MLTCLYQREQTSCVVRLTGHQIRESIRTILIHKGSNDEWNKRKGKKKESRLS